MHLNKDWAIVFLLHAPWQLLIQRSHVWPACGQNKQENVSVRSKLNWCTWVFLICRCVLCLFKGHTSALFIGCTSFFFLIKTSVWVPSATKPLHIMVLPSGFMIRMVSFSLEASIFFLLRYVVIRARPAFVAPGHFPHQYIKLWLAYWVATSSLTFFWKFWSTNFQIMMILQLFHWKLGDLCQCNVAMGGLLCADNFIPVYDTLAKEIWF